MVADVYIRFKLHWQQQLNHLNKEIEDWCNKYQIRHAKKVVKQYLRLTFDDDKHYSLFALTWSGEPFELMNINSY